MASLIDDTKPVSGSPTTASVRTQFTTAKSEITALQADKAPIASPTLTGTVESSDSASGTAAVSAVLRNTDEVVSSSSNIYFATGSGTPDATNVTGFIRGKVEVADPSALEGSMRFFTNAGDAISERLTILADGSVGVGQVAPTEKLDISQGIIRVSNDITPAVETDGASYFGKIGSNAVVSGNSGVALRVAATERLAATATGVDVTGTLDATGAITGASVAATGAVTGASVTATGGVSGTNFVATTGNVVASSGQVQTGTLQLGGVATILYSSGSTNVQYNGGGSNIDHAFLNSGGIQFTIKSNGVINVPSMPTTASGLSSGDLYSDSGTIKIVA